MTEALPAPIATPIDPAIDATTAVLAWIAARFGREQMLERRLLDAKAQCGG